MVRITFQISDGDLMQLDEAEIHEGQQLIFGRGPSDITIADRQISDQHLALMIENGKLVAHDMGSKTGTFCQGQKIASKPIVTNDVLELGSHYIRFVACKWED